MLSETFLREVQFMRINIAPRQRRGLSVTSLIDIVFLLLLFFMLTSSFSHFSKTQITSAESGVMAISEHPSILAKPLNDGWLINGQPVSDSEITDFLSPYLGKGTDRILLSVSDEVSAQRLVGALEVLRGLKFKVTVSR